jgi:hypothetical protein
LGEKASRVVAEDTDSDGIKNDEEAPITNHAEATVRLARRFSKLLPDYFHSGVHGKYSMIHTLH